MFQDQWEMKFSNVQDACQSTMWTIYDIAKNNSTVPYSNVGRSIMLYILDG